MSLLISRRYQYSWVTSFIIVPTTLVALLPNHIIVGGQQPLFPARKEELWNISLSGTGLPTKTFSSQKHCPVLGTWVSTSAYRFSLAADLTVDRLWDPQACLRMTNFNILTSHYFQVWFLRFLCAQNPLFASRLPGSYKNHSYNNLFAVWSC